QVFPFGGPNVRGSRFEIFGRPDLDPRTEVYFANPAYLDAIRLPLLRGRWFNDADVLNSAPVAVLSQVVANRYFGNDEPIGSRVRFNPERAESRWLTVIGIVADTRNPVGRDWQPTSYRPVAQTPATGATLMIRAAVGDPRSLTTAVRHELLAIDPLASEFRL